MEDVGRLRGDRSVLVCVRVIFLPPPFHISHSGSSLVRMAVFVGALLVTEALLNAKRRSDLARLAVGEEFRSLAATSPDGIFIKDDTCLVTFANPALLRMFGMSEHEVLGRSATELLPGFEMLQSSGEFVSNNALVSGPPSSPPTVLTTTVPPVAVPAIAGLHFQRNNSIRKREEVKSEPWSV